MKFDLSKAPEEKDKGRNNKDDSAIRNVFTAAEKTRTCDPADNAKSIRELADIMSAVNLLPNLRESRIREIKQSIDAGTYTVNLRRVAENILKEIWILLTA